MKEEIKPSKKILTGYEQETIINFNKDDKLASIFTYEKRWQKHLEQRLGLKPTMDNGFGGKGYLIDKRRIPLPRVSRVGKPITPEHLTKLRKARSLFRKPT